MSNKYLENVIYSGYNLISLPLFGGIIKKISHENKYAKISINISREILT